MKDIKYSIIVNIIVTLLSIKVTIWLISFITPFIAPIILLWLIIIIYLDQSKSYRNFKKSQKINKNGSNIKNIK